MTITVILLAGELIALFFLSRRVIQTIYTIVHVALHSRPVGISIISLIFFPGTVIHELSHLFVAEILGVRTGNLTLVPESIESTDVRTGSVAISQTDPLRRTLIGLSPIFVGLLTLLTLSYLHSTQFVNNTTITIVYYYLIFSISNSMFSSKEDLKGVWPVLGLIALVGIGAYVVGFRAQLTGQVLTVTETILSALFTSLTLVLALNGAILLVFSVLIGLIGKIRR